MLLDSCSLLIEPLFLFDKVCSLGRVPTEARSPSPSWQPSLLNGRQSRPAALRYDERVVGHDWSRQCHQYDRMTMFIESTVTTLVVTINRI